jgi:hypothetical protein
VVGHYDTVFCSRMKVTVPFCFSATLPLQIMSPFLEILAPKKDLFQVRRNIGVNDRQFRVSISRKDHRS